MSPWAVLNTPSQIVMINRTTQRCHDLGKDVSYLPHRVGGKLHVLKVEHSFAAPRLDDTGGGVGGYRRDLEEHGKIITINSFVKGDYARCVWSEERNEWLVRSIDLPDSQRCTRMHFCVQSHRLALRP